MELLIRPLEQGDLPGLEYYLQGLGPLTRSRFGPHGYDLPSLRQFYSYDIHRACIATYDNRIVGYAILRKGYLEHDRQRLEGYGLILNQETDGCFAPSLADDWQGRGIGNRMLVFLLALARQMGLKRLILWGGVQAGNELALKYYLKNGFKELGRFEYFGENIDMVLEL